MAKEPCFWGQVDKEQLFHTDEYGCIEEILDDMNGPFPEKITICAFARMEVNTIILHPLEDCLEALDEEYGNPDNGEYSESTEVMREAERAFLTTIKKEYTPWMCEEVCRKEIVVTDWIKENRPDWLEEKGK